MIRVHLCVCVLKITIPFFFSYTEQNQADYFRLTLCSDQDFNLSFVFYYNSFNKHFKLQRKALEFLLFFHTANLNNLYDGTLITSGSGPAALAN